MKVDNEKIKKEWGCLVDYLLRRRLKNIFVKKFIFIK